MNRLPIRARLTLVFALAMAVVLLLAGSLVYVRVASNLNDALDEQLRSRAQDVSALVRRDGSLKSTSGTLVEHGESFAELLARLRALVRRGGGERPTELVAGSLRLDPASRRAWRGRTEISLSPKEFALLEAFMRRPGQVLSRLQLLEHAWDFAYENRSNVVDVYVRYLREKVDRPFDTESIETVRGVGYRLREDPEA